MAGMGADIFESFVGSIIAAMIIASTSEGWNVDYVMMPILLGFIGYIASIVGVFSMAFLKNGRTLLLHCATPPSLAPVCSGSVATPPSTKGLIDVEMGIMHSVVLGSSSVSHRLVTEYYTGIEPVMVSRPRPSRTSVRCPRPAQPPTPSLVSRSV